MKLPQTTTRMRRSATIIMATALLISACSSTPEDASTPISLPMFDDTSTPASIPVAVTTTTTSSGPVISLPATTSPQTTAPATTVPATTAAPTTTASNPTTTTTAQPNSCSSNDYTVEYPTTWYSSSTVALCELFSPAPIIVPAEVEFQFEIQLYVSTQPFATVAANPGGTVLTDVPATVDGQPARVIEIENNGDLPGPTHNRYSYIVDLGNRTLIATASEYTDGSAAATSDYPGAKTTLDQMMQNISVMVGIPNAKFATCTADPAITGTVLAADSSWDLDGDGINDAVTLLDNAATNGGWIQATLSTGGAIEGTIDVLDTNNTPPLVLKLADLDIASATGEPEAIFTAGFGASGHHHDVMHIDGCDWIRPAADPAEGFPELVTSASAAVGNSWGCAFGPHGEIELTTSVRNFDSTAAITSWSDEWWQFTSGSWNHLGGLDSATSPNSPAPALSDPCPFA